MNVCRYFYIFPENPYPPPRSLLRLNAIANNTPIDKPVATTLLAAIPSALFFLDDEK